MRHQCRLGNQCGLGYQRSLGYLCSLGYFRGIVRKLDEIESLDPSHAGFVQHLRSLARQFQLDAMTRIIRQGLALGRVP